MISTIQSALASLAKSLPAAAMRMQHGECAGDVLATSSVDLSGEAITADAPVEVRRVIGSRRDFPRVERGSTVQLDGEFRIVTSAKTDPVGASLSIGVSAALDGHVVTIVRHGTPIRQALRVLASESDVLDSFGEALAPTTCRAWFVCFSAEDWVEVTDPLIGDDITLDDTRLRVSSVRKQDGFWILTCRARR